MKPIAQIWPQIAVLAWILLVFSAGIYQNGKRSKPWLGLLDLAFAAFLIGALYAGGFWTPLGFWP